MWRILLVLLLAAFGFSPAYAQDNLEIQSYQDSIDHYVKASFWIDLEQDFLLDFLPGINQDRNYTQGTAFTYQSAGLRKSILFLPLEGLAKLQEKLQGRSSLLVMPSTLSIGITAFTPRVIDADAPILGDRPFANLAWLSTQGNTFNLRSGWFTQTGLHVGWMGSNTANVFQSFAHRSLVPGRPTDISWKYQLSQGGAPAFMFSLRSMKSLVQFPRDTSLSHRWLDISLGGQVQAGWYTSAGIPLQIRIGRISVNSIWSTDLATPLANGNKLLGKATQKRSDSTSVKAPIPEKAFHEAYLMICIQPRITPHNSLILGQAWKNDPYALPDEWYNPLILDLEYGLVFSRLIIRQETLIPVKRFDVILSMLSRSSEITNSTYKRWHHWGRISLRFPLG